MLARTWPHIRAVLVALHVVAITLLALPAPDGAMNPDAWKQPTVQAEFKSWTASLNACGSDITQEELEARLWKLSNCYMDARGQVLEPFGPYYGYCGTYQSWRMFAGPQRFPALLHIDISEEDQWRSVFIERDPEHRWLARQFGSYRFRAFLFRLGSPGFEGEYQKFAQWVAARAAEDFPQADRVRVRQFRFAIRSPENARAGNPVEGEFVQSVELPLRVQP